MQYKHISPNKLHKDIDSLIKKLKKLDLDTRNTLIIAIGRGGLVPAQYVAYGLDIREMSMVQAKTYDSEEMRDQKEIEITGIFDFDFESYTTFLFIDDMYDTGTTLKNVTQMFTEFFIAFTDSKPNFLSAVIYTHDKSIVNEGVIYGKKIKTKKGKRPWLVFPWDN